jgi:hypothetical protein
MNKKSIEVIWVFWYDDDDDTKSIDKLIFIKFYVVWPNNSPQSRNKSPSHTLLKVIRTKSLFEYICEKILRKKKYFKKNEIKKSKIQNLLHLN